MSMINFALGLSPSLTSYLSGGAAYMMGANPIRVDSGGRTVWEAGAGNYHQPSPRNATFDLKPSPNWAKKSWGGAAWDVAAGPVLGIGFTAVSIYSGWSEGGLGGAYDAAVWELATSAGAARWGYSSAGAAGSGIRTPGTPLKSGGFIGGSARFLGASIGASIGQGIAGTPGAFVGGYFGAAPMAASMRHPVMGLGALAVAGAATVGYGAYHVVKSGAEMGRQHAQLKRGLDTSGSMAAHMTAGAQTMRARAVSAIHKSHLNARSALGQEASFFHYPGRNYHSRYR